MSAVLDDGVKVLFQGDSITDAGRVYDDPASLGSGYAYIAASWFSALYPEKSISFLNRGISGNRAEDLVNRWQKDCMDLKPDWISIMIGINDTWRAFDSNDPTSTESYENSYRKILVSARDKLNARFILMEPFVLPYPEDRKQWRKDLDPRIGVMHKLADEFDAVIVKLDSIFADAAKRREPSYWASDGVHPTGAGHALIAISWLKAVGAA